MNQGIKAYRQRLHARIYATDKQLAYLRILLNRAFVLHIHHGFCLDVNHLDNVKKDYASNVIGTLKTLIAEKENLKRK